MGCELREMLSRLCIEIGWTYAVFWKAIRGVNQPQLVWGEGHCEKVSVSGFEAMDLLLKEKVALRNFHENHVIIEPVTARADDRLNTLVYKFMVNQIHAPGEGVVGQAALTGNHIWILQDNLNNYGSISKGSTEMNQQFWAGIQTVAVIPVLPHGVVQLGSTNMVMEDVGFINHVKCLFATQIQCEFSEDSRRFLPQNPTVSNPSDLFYDNLRQIEKQLLSTNTDEFNANETKPVLTRKFQSMTINEGSSDLFDVLGLKQKPSCTDSSRDVTDVGPTVSDSNEDDVFFNGLLSEADPDQLLDAIVSKITSSGSAEKTRNNSVNKNHNNLGFGSSASVKSEPGASSSGVKSENSSGGYKSQISLWVENGPGPVVSGSDRELGKPGRKRPRPGENPRPRPKDRQLIQDRIKELREIVPNGAKCSIDALLEKTIKHMLFLQSVAKHADKLKQTGEPKIMSKEGGLVLKDNKEGGATWAFEVGTQSMTCPILVEDLNSPRQMLVEMLCKERGLFLEIADQIRGLGLTILKGVMEIRKDKIWARFAVEANKDVTRMEIFLSLVHLLEPNAGNNLIAKGIDGNLAMQHKAFYPSIPATGLM